MSNKYYFIHTTVFLIVFFIIQTQLFSQNNKINELKKDLQQANEDTNKVNILNALAAQYVNIGDYINAKEDADNALLLIKELSTKNKISKEDAIKKEKASYTAIGNIFFSQGNYSEAYNIYFMCLKKLEKIGDFEGVSDMYYYIRLIYDHMGDKKELRKIDSVMIELQKQGFGVQYEVSYDYENSNNSEEDKIPQDQIDYLIKFGLKENLDDKQAEAIINTWIALGNEADGNYSEAYESSMEAIKVAEETGDKESLAYSYIIGGKIFVKQHKYIEAREYFDKALKLSKEISNKEKIRATYLGYSILDSANNNYKEAYENYKRYNLYGDSIGDIENTKKIVQMKMSYDFAIKETVIKAEQEKKAAIARYAMVFDYENKAKDAENDRMIKEAKIRYDFDSTSAATKAESNKQLALEEEKRKNQLIFWSIVCASMLIIGFLSFIVYKKRKKESFLRKLEQLTNKVLRLKIPPHFVKNSLSAIKENIYTSGIESSLEYIDMLTHLMINVINNSRNEEISLEEDINALRFFIELRNLQKENKVKWEIEIDENIDTQKTIITPNLVQPIVENCFDHAFTGISNPELKIKVFLKDNMIYFIVKDNGIGFSPNSKFSDKNSSKVTGIGLETTAQRINIIKKTEKKDAFLNYKNLIDKNQKILGAFVEMAVPLKIGY